MAGLVWGGKDQLLNTPVMIGIISSMSPLQYSAEMAGALIEYQRRHQNMNVDLRATSPHVSSKSMMPSDKLSLKFMRAVPLM